MKIWCAEVWPGLRPSIVEWCWYQEISSNQVEVFFVPTYRWENRLFFFCPNLTRVTKSDSFHLLTFGLVNLWRLAPRTVAQINFSVDVRFIWLSTIHLSLLSTLHYLNGAFEYYRKMYFLLPSLFFPFSWIFFSPYPCQFMWTYHILLLE